MKVKLNVDYETLPISDVFCAILNLARLLPAQQKCYILRRSTEASPLAISSLFPRKYLNIYQEQEI